MARDADLIDSALSSMFEDDISTGRRLFFVQGLWRSGTSWVGRILGSPPQAYVCHHELQSFMRELEVTQFKRPLDAHPFLKSRYAASRKAGFLSILLHLHKSEKPSATLIGERSPGANVLLLKETFPEARLVIVLRDGRDICVSAAFLARRAGSGHECFEDEANARLAGTYVEDVARLYATYVADYLSLKAAHPKDVLLVRYEDLSRDPADGVRTMFAFLGIEMDESARADIGRGHSFVNEAKRQPGEEDTGSLQRKGVVGDWKERFSPDNVTLFERIAGSALERCGYPIGGGLR